MIYLNVCKCGAEIPFVPGRRKQPKWCAKCRSFYGGNAQKGKRKAALRGGGGRRTARERF